MSHFVMAAIQAAPIHLDPAASTDKACQLIAEAAAGGATVAAFGECWLPGYPLFAYAEPSPARWSLGAAYIASAIKVPGAETERLCQAARKGKIDVVIGVLELDERTQGTVYCTLLFIGRDGNLVGKHRKIKPTYHERTAWGEGDGSTLVVHERPYARLSGLNCWEHQMMLPGYALVEQGTQIHVAAWPGRHLDPAPAAPVSLWPKQVLLSRAFASQAAAYVICAAGINRRGDYPEAWRELAWLEGNGGSCIIDPRGEIIAGPVTGEETILYAEGSLDLVRAAKSACDIAGHYSRPDVFAFEVRREGLSAALSRA